MSSSEGCGVTYADTQDHHQQADEVGMLTFMNTVPEEGAKDGQCRCADYYNLSERHEVLMKEYVILKAKNNYLTKRLAETDELKQIVNDFKSIRNTMVKSMAAATAEDSSENTDDPTMKNIGNGIMVDKTILQDLIECSEGPSQLARNLFSVLFKTNEVIGKTLSGRKRNFYGNRLETRLDPKRVEAIVDYTRRVFPSASTTDLRQVLVQKVQHVNISLEN